MLSLRCFVTLQALKKMPSNSAAVGKLPNLLCPLPGHFRKFIFLKNKYIRVQRQNRDRNRPFTCFINVIDMLSASQQKFLTALQVKKYRQKYHKFTVEGSKLVLELLAQKRISVSAIYGLERWQEENAAAVAAFNSIFTPVSEAGLKKISALTTPNAVLAVAEMPETPDTGLPLGGSTAFYLDGIRDPGNMGAILRIADWFGFPAVYCSPDCADAYNQKVVQASMGAVFRVPVQEIAFANLLSANPGWPALGAVLDGENLFETELPAEGLLVIGSEGSGISPAVETQLTRRLTIPRGEGGGAESLNASVAAGILAAFMAGRAKKPAF